MSAETYTYHPPRWVRIAVAVSFLIFVAMLAIALVIDLKPMYVALSAGMVVFAALAVVESIVARVFVEPDAVVIKGLFKTERVALSNVEKVSAAGGGIALFLNTKKWKKLPDWLGANMSARRRIADRIGH
ncbi:MAG TPA: hypothetical protein VEC56_08325 [Candidatus Krumholzibacteria bacterium]|nr:hypothetical protein [Candidatus Krumholzibacteria bacterium]